MSTSFVDVNPQPLTPAALDGTRDRKCVFRVMDPASQSDHRWEPREPQSAKQQINMLPATQRTWEEAFKHK